MNNYIRIRFNANGVEWFNHVNRKWIPLSLLPEQVLTNITNEFYRVLGIREVTCAE
jgi:hypothetical protein